MTDMRKVNSGDSNEYSAATHNRFIDATLWAEAQRASKDRLPKVDFKNDGICRVKNDSGENLPRFSILGISEPLYSPRTKLQKFQQEYTLLGVIPETPTHECKFVVLAEPIPDGEIGFAWCDGIAPAKLRASTADSGDRADIIDGDVTQLKSTDSGVRIVWKDDTDDGDYRWALVHLGTCVDGSDFPGPDGGCCGGCVCKPEEEDLITDCAAVPCLVSIYSVSGKFPFSGNVSLAHDTGCIYLSDSFAVTICDVEYGDFHWKLTVSDDPHGSQLELVNDGTGPDIPLLYKSYKTPFNPICGNTFAIYFDCDMPKHLAHLFPCEICVVASGPDCEGCNSNGVSACDCPYPIPNNLTVTFSAPSCPQFDGLAVPITYIGEVGATNRFRWLGEITGLTTDGTTICTQPFRVVFDVIGGIACEYDIGLVSSEVGATNTAGLPDGRDIWGTPGGPGHGEIACPFAEVTTNFTVTGSAAVPVCVSGCFGLMEATISP